MAESHSDQCCYMSGKSKRHLFSPGHKVMKFGQWHSRPGKALELYSFAHPYSLQQFANFRNSSSEMFNTIYFLEKAMVIMLLLCIIF